MQFRILLLAILIALPNNGWSKTPIDLLTYHITPPFITNSIEKLGLSYDVAEYLTLRSKGKYEFTVKPLPRLRLNQIIERGTNCAVLWANPVWFNDKAQTKFNWSPSFFKDSNSIISSPRSPIEYDGPASLIGYTLVGLRGGKWVGLDLLIKEKKIQKHEVSSYAAAIKSTATGRSDGAILPRSVADYYIKNSQLMDQIHFSQKAHSDYSRHILICNNDGLSAFIREAISQIKQSEDWAKLLNKYNLSKQ